MVKVKKETAELVFHHLAEIQRILKEEKVNTELIALSVHDDGYMDFFNAADEEERISYFLIDGEVFCRE